MKEAFDFYAYWNGAQVADLWNTIALITSTEDYRTLLLCVTLFGFIAVMIGSAVRNRGMDALTWFAATVVLFGILFVPRVAINVKDVRSGAAQVVANVPIGIGWPASVVSRVSWWMTQTFETAFQAPDAASYTRFGVAFPQRVVTSVLAVKPMTDTGRVTLVNFAERCIVPEILDHPAKRQALLSAPDIYTLINSDGWVNPARRVMINGQVLTCRAALGVLTEALRVHEMPALESMLGATLSQSETDVMSGAIIAAIPNAEALMLGVSRSLHESLRQSLLMSVIPDATMTTAAKAGQAPMTAGVALARAQGNLASEINYRTLSDMAKSALPKLRNLLEFIVIGLFPIVFLLMIGLGTSGIIVIRAYFTLLISVGLWAPITAIINYLTIHVDAEPMNRLVDAAGGVTLAAATMIREGGATSQAMAGSLMWLVPVLAYAVAKGSDMALTSMASSVLNPAASAAQAQGSSIAMGNVTAGNASLGNVSTNNVGTNKTDASSLYGSQDLHRANIASGQWQASRGTGMVTAMSVAESNLGVTSAGQISTSVTRADTTGTVETKGFTSSQVHATSTTLTKSQGTVSTVNRQTGWSDDEIQSNNESVESAKTYSNTISNGSSASITSSGQSSEGYKYSSGLSTISTSQPSDQNFGALPQETNLIAPIGAPDAVSLKSPFGQNNLLAANGKPSPTSKTNGLEESTFSSVIQRVPVAMQGSTEAKINDGSSNSITTSANTQDQDSSSTHQGASTGTSLRSTESTTAQLGDAESSNLGTNKTTGTQNNNQKARSNSVSANYTEHKGSSIQTGIQMNNQLRDFAMKKYGDPNAALQDLNTNFQSRIDLAKDFSKQSNADLNSGIRSINRPNPQESFDFNESDLRNEHLAERQAVTATHDHSTQLREGEAASRKNKSMLFNHISSKDQNEIRFTRGLTLAASKIYGEEEGGFASVAKRSLGFGVGYYSGQEIYNRLHEEAEKNPELKKALIDIGGSRNTNRIKELPSIIKNH